MPFENWNVFMANKAAPRFFDSFNPGATHKSPRNILHLMFDPERMRPHIANWEAVAKSLFERVYRESVGRLVDDKTRELLDALLAYPDVKPEWRTPKASRTPSDGAANRLPVIPISFVRDGAVLSYFSMVATVGTPQTVAAQELRLECMFPLDEATERQHVALMESLPD
jgi:hypothetical protein